MKTVYILWNEDHDLLGVFGSVERAQHHVEGYGYDDPFVWREDKYAPGGFVGQSGQHGPILYLLPQEMYL